MWLITNRLIPYIWVLADSELTFTDVPEHTYFSLLETCSEFKYISEKNIVRFALIIGSFHFCETENNRYQRFVANQSVISSFLGEVPQFWRKGEISWSIQALYTGIYIYIWTWRDRQRERQRERERKIFRGMPIFTNEERYYEWVVRRCM